MKYNKAARYDVGDKIFLSRSYGHGLHYTEATVVKTTPGGCIDAKIGECEPMRFRPDGTRQGGDRYSDYRIDDLPYHERVAEVARQNRLRKAANALANVKAEGGINERWGTDGLARELDRLQGLLDFAREALGAVDPAPAPAEEPRLLPDGTLTTEAQ